MIATKLSGVLLYLANVAGYVQVANAGSALLNIQGELELATPAALELWS